VTSSLIVGIARLIATPTVILFGWLSDHIGRKPVILAGMLLAALTYYPLYSWLGTATQPGHINYPVADFHHLHPGVLRRDDLWADRSVLAEYFPGQDPLHVGVGALSHRQRVGRGIGAVHHLGGPFSPPAASATR